MRRTTACLVVHPRSGKNHARVPEIVAVLTAAGWTTDVVMKESKGQTMELAARAAESGYDFVVAYGGDGTLNHVLNGVLAFAGNRGVAVACIPGGTSNVWAAEAGIPSDPVRAAKVLAESEVRTVDVGHVGVESVTLGDDSTERDRDAASAAGARRHFLLMAGLGLDAALMRRSPSALKHRFGVTAVALTAIRYLPSMHTFQVDITASPRAAGSDAPSPLRWSGSIAQLVVGNTRNYGKVTEMTPDARLDDGALDVSVIAANGRIAALAKMAAVVLHGRPYPSTGTLLSGAQLRVSAPASVDLQLDGSAVRLKKYLTKAGKEAIERAGDPSRAIVHYTFDAIPSALRIAMPRDYHGPLFGTAR
jgi:diacylglycerol kinase family enzyme